METKARLAVVVALALLAGGLYASPAPAQQPVKLGYSTWVGYGPLFLARDKGFYKEAGVAVELVKMEDPKLRFAALAAKKLDGLVSTLDTMTLYVKPDVQLAAVLGLDDSKGGDGIVADKAIKTIADLKGKRIAFPEGSVSHFFLSVLLRQHGLTEKDIIPINMTAGDAGAAFVAKKVDAAVTWEPWLSRGKRTEHGHLLIDSSKTPGLIVDVLIFRKDVLQKRGDEVRGIVKAWHRAVEFWKENPRQANELMAGSVGGWLKDVKVFAETLAGIRYYDFQANKEFFGTPQRPGTAYKTAQFAIDIWSELGKIRMKLRPEDILDNRYLTR
ncbi:MAG: ABC transporter substrate-binding protein [Armatimonadota bacterium]|nr:ABC transporter substrate-binding protein [Armatimonadota bacterium]MDR7505972.1 ABC transporter substrate-binding protein [Armatimonadota bacterium]MDR7527629.1 ABC transporter substrate-binding protein [Armatimonadota bacterium]MDR7576959.1 ABC transporter substrate-binding protein [Armatimonadota bacterium]